MPPVRPIEVSAARNGGCNRGRSIVSCALCLLQERENGPKN